MAAPASDMTTDISIHAPREGSDKGRFDFYHPMLAFLSTLPVRGATVGVCPSHTHRSNFYPRSP